MNVQKFTAATSREAWRMVRDALGADAIILSNRTVNGMSEILAMASDDISSLSDPVQEPEVVAVPAPAPAPKPVTRPAHMPAAAPKAVVAPAIAPSLKKRGIEGDQAASLASALQTARLASQAAQVTPAQTAENNELMSEIRSMRGMLESQLTELAWSGTQQKRNPAMTVALKEMLSAGFSATLSRYVVERLPAGATAEGALSWVKAVLARNMSIIGDENELLEKGGVYALVGPTGVGKTTTTAKLAARCVMRHGPSKLGLITTDGYRIGGYEQLRIYGKILGVMVHSVKDEADLRIALEELRGKHTVLIDTVGMSQRDKMVGEQISMLSGAESQVKRLLCLSATSTGETLSEVIRAYQGDGLAGCIMTKLDEAATIGSTLDVVIRQKLNLYYVANGQRVPEDLHVANQQYLVDRAFKLKRETAPFQYQDDELPLVVSNAARQMQEKTARGVSLG
jgi:flagellar biosynthesis protein FlhF